MAQRPDAGAPFHPLSIPFFIEGTNEDGPVQGTAIGIGVQGRDVYYLVVNELSESAPVWVYENSVAKAYVSGPIGR
jgi:hypothetical protein